jgi:NAD+ kinase
MFERVGIIAKYADSEVRQALAATIAVLTARNCEIAIDENCATVNSDPTIRAVAEQEVVLARDLVIAIGGDGTLLRAAKLAFPSKAVVLGVNLGRLGFLTDLSPDQVPSSLNQILDGNYITEERVVLRAEIIRDGAVVESADGLNDVVIQKWNSARLIAFDTYVDGRFVFSQRSDGMIISTPTGSTAYSLSGGGPILHPQLNAMVLVPICPHSLTNRPIVLADTATIEIVMEAEYADESRLICDGEAMVQIRAGDNIRITRHQRTVHLIHPTGHDHFANLRAKLHWGRAPC